MSSELPLIISPGKLTPARRGDAVQLQAGGQAVGLSRVVVPGGATYLVKRYSEETIGQLRIPRLLDMIRWRRNLSPADRAELDRRCAWPLAAVGTSQRVEGILIAEAPAEMFEHRTSPTGKVTRVPRHLDALIRSPKAAERTAEKLGLKKAYYEPPYKLAVLGELLDTVNWLHDRGYAVGDLQPRNAIFTLEPRPQVFLLDCDSCVPLGGEGALPQVDPELYKLPEGQRDVRFDQRSDYYKFALSVVRCIQESAQTWRPDREILSRVMRTELVDTIIECARALPPPEARSRLRGAASVWPRLVSGERMYVSTDATLRQAWPSGVSAVDGDPAPAPPAPGPVPVPPPRPAPAPAPPSTSQSSGSGAGAVLVVVVLILVVLLLAAIAASS